MYHISNVTKILSKVLDIHHSKIIYAALVESTDQYGILECDGVANIHLRKLENIQTRFLNARIKT